MAEAFVIKSDNALLQVKLYARPASETVILLHGGPGLPDEMTEVREFLSEHIQVITFDQRGTGGNPCPKCSYSMQEYVSDINRIAAFFHIEKFHLFGHSWGGLYAQIYAQKYPERILSLFLCSPVSGTGKLWDLIEKEVFQYNRKVSTKTEWIMMGMNALLGMLGNERAYRRLFRQVIINYHKGFHVEPPEPEKLAKINARAASSTRQHIRHYPPLKAFGKTDYPVIITYGEFDVYGKSKSFIYELFPEAKYFIIPGSGHTAWKHNLPELKKIMYDFYIKTSC